MESIFLKNDYIASQSRVTNMLKPTKNSVFTLHNNSTNKESSQELVCTRTNRLWHQGTRAPGHQDH
jgi:hypothetical protein